MRTIKNLPVPKEQDLVKFPNSTILNETDTNDGTPVVREIYGDFITNIYAFLVDRGIIPNEIEDNEVNGYQFLDALKLNVNKLNDVHRVLGVIDQNTFSIDIDFSLISNSYPIFVKCPEDVYITNRNRYITDSKGISKNVKINKNINAGDELLLIISDEINVINLIHDDLYDNKLELNVQGVPLSYSTSNLNDFLSDNVLIYNDGSSIDLMQFLDANLVIRDVVLINEYYLIFCVNSVDNKLKLYRFRRGELNVSELFIQGVNDNNQDAGLRTYAVKMYVFKNKIAFSHKIGNVFNPYILSFFDYDDSNLLKFNSEVTLDPTFSGTSNYLMGDDYIIITDTLSQDLYKYTFTRQKEPVYAIKQNVVNLYTKNTNDRYIQVDETAVKWK